MEIIIESKNLKSKYLITSDSNCYTVAKMLLDDNGKVRTDKKGKYLVSSKDKTYPTKAEYLFDSLYEKTLRDNDCKMLEEYGEHYVETKKFIKETMSKLGLDVNVE
jgi:hypothetical protein